MSDVTSIFTQLWAHTMQLFLVRKVEEFVVC